MVVKVVPQATDCLGSNSDSSCVTLYRLFNFSQPELCGL